MKKLLIGLLLLTGCAPVLKQGIVISKEHIPAISAPTFCMLGAGVNNTLTAIPMHLTFPDKWIVVIADENRTSRIMVTEDSYDAVKSGDYVETRK